MNQKEAINNKFQFVIPKKKFKKRNYLEMLSSYKENSETKLSHLFQPKFKMDENFNLNNKFENLILSNDSVNNSSDNESEISYYSADSNNENEFSISSDYSIKENYSVLKTLDYKKNPIYNQNEKKDSKILKEHSKETNNFKNNNNNTSYINTKQIKKSGDDSSSSDDSEHSQTKGLEIDNKDIYNPSKLNEPLRNLINNHQNIAPENLLIIENEGNGNCLFLSISL